MIFISKFEIIDFFSKFPESMKNNNYISFKFLCIFLMFLIFFKFQKKQHFPTAATNFQNQKTNFSKKSQPTSTHDEQ